MVNGFIVDVLLSHNAIGMKIAGIISCMSLMRIFYVLNTLTMIECYIYQTEQS